MEHNRVYLSCHGEYETCRFGKDGTMSDTRRTNEELAGDLETMFRVHGDNLYLEAARRLRALEGERRALEKISVLHDHHVTYLDGCSMADDMGWIAKKALENTSVHPQGDSDERPNDR